MIKIKYDRIAYRADKIHPGGDVTYNKVSDLRCWATKMH